jgi:hypothetical protein
MAVPISSSGLRAGNPYISDAGQLACPALQGRGGMRAVGLKRIPTEFNEYSHNSTRLI